MDADAGWLQDMLDAAKETIEFVTDMELRSFADDARTQRAVERNIAIIGEAASQVSEECRAAIPELPWRQMVGMRHLLIHRYFNVDTAHLWEVASTDLPVLIDAIQRYVDPTRQ